MRSLAIQIPQPCHERWAEMQPTEQGRFCTSCQKTVVDYTTLSDQELVRRLSQPMETTCGRFRNEQLNRPLALSKSGLSPLWRHWIGLLTMSLFGWQTARAQLSQPNGLSRSNAVRPDYSVTTRPIRSATGSNATCIVTGRVMLMDSSGRLSPTPNADVVVGGLGQTWQAKTDTSGTFTLVVPTQLLVTELNARAYIPGQVYGQTTFEVSPSTTSVVVNDIIIRQRWHQTPAKDITGGGIALVHMPSRWQRFKRHLFH